jgi:hypothetical protein
MTCDSVNIIEAPNGRAAFRIHSFIKSDTCNAITLTAANVVSIVSGLAGDLASADADLRHLVKHVRKSFDDAMAPFAATGAPNETGASEYAAWRYVEDTGGCRVLLLTTTLDRFGPGSGYVEVVEDLACD